MLNTKIAELLGEENEKRLKDRITDILIEQAEEDIKERYKYEYVIAFDDIFKKVAEEIEEETKKRMKEKYMKMLEEKLSNLKRLSGVVKSHTMLSLMEHKHKISILPDM